MSVAAIFLTTMAVGAAMDAVGKIKQAQQTASAQAYNAQIAEQQAKAYQQAGAFEQAGLTQKGAFEQASIKTSGAAEEARLKREKAKTTSAQRSAYAQAGVRLEGSPLAVMADTAAQYELDISASRYNTELGLAQSRYGTQLGLAQSKYSTALGVAQSLSEAQYLKQSAKRTKALGYWGAGTTLLTGGSKIAGYYANK